MTGWQTIALVGIVTAALKASGPLMFGNRALPTRLTAVIDLAGPVLLTALVVAAIFIGRTGPVIDARAVGLAAALGCALLRAPLLVVVFVAAAATALTRAMA